jgi:PAS domain S-box-containing protein
MADQFSSIGNVSMNDSERVESDRSENMPESNDGGLPAPSSVFQLSRECETLRQRIAELASEAARQEACFEELRQRESKYRELVENSCSIILRMDSQGNVTFANQHALAFFGFTDRELLGKNVIGTIVPFIERTGRKLTDLIRDICDHPERYRDNENENVQQDGVSKWIAWTNKGICDASGHPTEIICIGNDITPRKEAEEALQQEQETLRHMLESQQHDLQLVAYDAKAARAAYQNGSGLLDLAITETRRLIANLRPPDMEASGVVNAVRQWLGEQGSQIPFKVELICDEPFERLDSVREHALFRIVQEGINNAARHSGSDKVRVAFRQREGQVSLEIMDWGGGFDTSIVGAGHFGLKGIYERARILGGNASIESTPGQGTRITVQFPLGSEESSIDIPG